MQDEDQNRAATKVAALPITADRTRCMTQVKPIARGAAPAGDPSMNPGAAPLRPD